MYNKPVALITCTLILLYQDTQSTSVHRGQTRQTETVGKLEKHTQNAVLELDKYVLCEHVRWCTVSDDCD